MCFAAKKGLECDHNFYILKINAWDLEVAFQQQVNEIDHNSEYG